MFRSLIFVVAVSAIFPPFVLAEFPSSDAVDKALKHAKETREDIGDASVGTLGRNTLLDEVETINTIAAIADLNIERLEHLMSLSLLLESAEGVGNDMEARIELLARLQAVRVATATKNELARVATASQDAKDPGVVAVIGDVRDRVRECRDLWAECK